MFSAAVDSSWASFDRVHFYIISLNTLIPVMAEEDYLIFFTGEGEWRVERRLKKSQVTTERLAQMIRELKQRRRQRQRKCHLKINISLFHLCYFAIISSRSTYVKMANYPGIKLVGVAYKLRKPGK